MQKEEFIAIASRVSEGLASDLEKQLFLFHIGTFAKENPEWEKLNPEFRQQIEVDIKSDIRLQVFGEVEHNSKTIKLWPRVAIVAAVTTIIFGAGLFFYKNQQKEIKQTITVANEIAPGKTGATLTLANGKKIHLTEAANGELAKEAGVTVTKSANGQLIYEINNPLSSQGESLSKGERSGTNILSTAKGETYQVRLPDGSLVWLNAASSLTYPVSLKERGLRRVKLEGEAYFEIAKDKDHPFIVATDNQEIEVLGTHFNVNAYTEEPSSKTTLLEGSVAVTPLSAMGRDVARDREEKGKSSNPLSPQGGSLPGGENRIVLKPNQQSVLTNTGIKIRDADIEEAVAWKSGYFKFENEEIHSIMRKVARWYNVDVKYETGVSEKGLSGTISRFQNVSKILEMLQATKLIKFRVEGNTITVMKSS